MYHALNGRDDGLRFRRPKPPLRPNRIDERRDVRRRLFRPSGLLRRLLQFLHNVFRNRRLWWFAYLFNDFCSPSFRLTVFYHNLPVFVPFLRHVHNRLKRVCDNSFLFPKVRQFRARLFPLLDRVVVYRWYVRKYHSFDYGLYVRARPNLRYYLRLVYAVIKLPNYPLFWLH